MQRIRRFVFVSLISLVPVAAHAQGPAKKTAAAQPAPKAKPKKLTPMTAAHKKALTELFGGFKFGMSKDEVVAAFSKQLDEQYEEQIQATTDVSEQDRLRKAKKGEVQRFAQSYTTFEANKPSPWDVSIIETEFRHGTGESMLERWENTNGKNQRRFFFFHEGKLWKMFLSLDMSVLPEDKKNFATFRQVMEGKYGPGDIDNGEIAWRTEDLEARALDKLKSYDALGLTVADAKVGRQVEAMREEKKAPPSHGNPVINAVIDTDHSDHPDTKANANAVDDVIRAQGGTPPKRR
ncbi:MAG TPA: hypothetical protein VFP84_02790 [Kofleriaceae bacterium]|nr:hypothetical protein [Kofleriaceae bacterium]